MSVYELSIGTKIGDLEWALMALWPFLHYFTEFVYAVIVKQLLGLYLGFKIYFW